MDASLLSTAPAVRAVIFDMDGVLCDSEPFMAAASIAMFRQLYGLAIAPEDFHDFVGTGPAGYFGGVARRFGVTLDLDAAKDLAYRHYLDLIRGRLRPLPGVQDLISALRCRGLRTAVATSANRLKLDGNLHEMGLDHGAFDALIAAEDIHRNKPDPEIFLLAADRLAVSPPDCLAVEDSPSGLAAARAAGMRTLALHTTLSRRRLAACTPDWIARDLSDLPEGVRTACGLAARPPRRGSTSRG